MIDISFMELIVIAVVALVVIAPKDLPRALRTVGNYVGKMRRMATDFQRQLNDAIRDEELDQLQKQVTEVGRSTEADIRRGLTIPPDNHTPTRRAVTVGAATQHTNAASARAAAVMKPLPKPAAVPAIADAPAAEIASATPDGGGTKP